MSLLEGDGVGSGGHSGDTYRGCIGTVGISFPSQKGRGLAHRECRLILGGEGGGQDV